MVTLFVLVMVCIGDSVLLLRRHNANFGNGLYSLVGGKVEAGETARAAIKREVFEEVGLVIDEAQFQLVHVFHRKGTENELVALCFKVNIEQLGQSPRNCEPQKADHLAFFNFDQLPENIIPAHLQALHCAKAGEYYSEHGWS